MKANQGVGRQNFATRLMSQVASTGPLCAGIDPSAEVLARWDLPDDAQGLAGFCRLCLEAFVDVVPVIKPQVAFFERHGAAGLAVLETLLADAASAGLLVIADAKRADIANTAAAYAQAWLDDASPLAADAVTALPYLGLGALDPMVEAARRSGRGLLVVVRSSNPEGRWLQEATAAGGQRVEDALLEQMARANSTENLGGAGQSRPAPRGTLGAVIGATLEPSAFDLAGLGGVVLTPGVGAQGAGPQELRRLFGGCPPGSVVANVSRSVLFAGPSVGGLRQAALEARAAAEAALS